MITISPVVIAVTAGIVDTGWWPDLKPIGAITHQPPSHDNLVCNVTDKPVTQPAGNGHCDTELFPPDSCYKVMWRGWARDCWYAGREVKR